MQAMVVQTAVQARGGLYDVLMRVAPQQEGRPKEVMIAISNYNLWPIGALPLWIKVLPLSIISPVLCNMHCASCIVRRALQGDTLCNNCPPQALNKLPDALSSPLPVLLF